MRALTERHSALYEGKVTHLRGRDVSHHFTSALTMCYLDLDELPRLLRSHPLWSAGRARPVQFRRSDYSGDPTTPLADSLRRLVEEETGRETGPVRLLAHLRTWSWCFNPLALGFVFDPAGEKVTAVVASVSNTPWRERHDYVLPADGDGRVDCRREKKMHVSPFLPMDETYRFRIEPPGNHLRAIVEAEEEGGIALRATLHLRRRPLDWRSMTLLPLRHPASSWRVSSGIYSQAARLSLKRAPFFPHPTKAR